VHPLHRVAGALLSGLLAAPLTLSALPAHADPGPDVDVTIALTPSNPAGLDALATHGPHALAERIAALQHVAPSSAARDRVTRWLRAHGLAVTSSSPWTVTASGGAEQAAAVFPHGQLPAALVADARAVIGLQQRPLFRHRATADGPLGPRLSSTLAPTQINAAYGSFAPAAAGTGATVASVQFSGWPQLAGTANGGDLVNYANANGLPVPTLTAISVNGASVTRPAAAGDDFEVALDQEAITSAAPGAAQRVYVSTNDATGGVLVWKRIADDVQAGVPISVVTTSWGDCEQDLGRTQILAMNDQIARLAALGVTVFAASGDASVWDCPAGTPYADAVSVDFPASSPYVVGVGGTTLRQSSTGWAETAWGPSLLSATPVAGSGGGVSALFTRPAWQRGVPGLPDRRLVPDISAVADPQNGFAVYWSGGGPGSELWWAAGGTSLGAPLQAGMFAGALAARGVTTGIGDVHPALYAHPEAFRDVVTGSNGLFPAGLGYDLVTGLGSPQWDTLTGDLLQPAIVAPSGTRASTVSVALGVPTTVGGTGYAVGQGVTDCTSAAAGSPPQTASTTVSPGGQPIGFALRTSGGCDVTTAPVVLDTTTPVGTATLSRYADGLLTAGWSATDGGTPSGLGYTIVLLRNGSPWLTTYASDSRSLLVGVPPSGIYQLQVQAADGAGNTDVWRTSEAVGPRGTCPVLLDGQPRCWAR
jgi:kumamolisin